MIVGWLLLLYSFGHDNAQKWTKTRKRSNSTHSPLFNRKLFMHFMIVSFFSFSFFVVLFTLRMHGDRPIRSELVKVSRSSINQWVETMSKMHSVKVPISVSWMHAPQLHTRDLHRQIQLDFMQFADEEYMRICAKWRCGLFCAHVCVPIVEMDSVTFCGTRCVCVCVCAQTNVVVFCVRNAGRFEFHELFHLIFQIANVFIVRNAFGLAPFAATVVYITLPLLTALANWKWCVMCMLVWAFLSSLSLFFLAISIHRDIYIYFVPQAKLNSYVMYGPNA